MEKRYLNATAATLGTFAGVCMIQGMSASSAYAWVDDNPAGVSQCTDPHVNDAGTVIGTCEVGNARKAFVRLASASSSTFLASLPSTVGGVPCVATGISNAAATTETIVGSCADANNVLQGVAWKAATPAVAPIQLQPLLSNVQTQVTAFNSLGVIVGISITSSSLLVAGGIRTPVSWSSTGVASPLPPPLGSSNANCVPADMNDARSPSIVGNCDNAGTGGGPKAVLWQGTGAAYTVLPVPSGASYCEAKKINLAGQILGQCTYGTDTRRVVRWGAGGTAAVVLTTVNGAAALRSSPADINDSGVIAANYIADGVSAGFMESCRWDPSGGNTNAVAISPPGGIAGPAIVIAIGNNGKMIGAYKTTAGTFHSFHVAPGGTTSVDVGTPAGGPNTIVTSMSKSGGFEAAASEDNTEHMHVEAQAVP